MGVQDEAERFEPASLEEWSAWLAAHHADRRGVWLVTAKRATGRQPFGYEAGVVEALRYGWVDAVQRSVDGERSMLWYSPRRPRSGWSAPNKERIERLEREGRLEAAGRAAVEVAKANGAWTLLDDVEALVVPDDLAEALAGTPGARERWDALGRTARRTSLEWVAQARTAPTRERRVREVTEAVAQGRRPR